MALTTALQIRTNYLNITDTSQDTLLTALIGQAQAIMESLCDQPLDQASQDVYFVGTGTHSKLLDYTVPVSLTSLYYREEPDASWTSVTGAVAYESDNLTRLYLSTGFVEPFYKATMAIGYSTVPSDLVNICSEMVVEMMASTDFGIGQNRFGVASLASSEGGVTQTTVYRDMQSRYRERLRGYMRRTW